MGPDSELISQIGWQKCGESEMSILHLSVQLTMIGMAKVQLWYGQASASRGRQTITSLRMTRLQLKVCE